MDVVDVIGVDRWRTTDRVREAWDAYREECWDWHFSRWRVGLEGPVYEGHLLEQRSPATVGLLTLLAQYEAHRAGQSGSLVDIADAKKKLWDALREGTLQGTGLSTKGGGRVVIPDIQWHDLVDFEERGRDVLRLRGQHASDQEGYDKVAFKRQDIVLRWCQRGQRSGFEPLPMPSRPEGAGFMPLFSAVHWIASRGATLVFNPYDVTIWKTAMSELLSRVASDQVTVTGVRNGEREKIPGHTFADIPVDYPMQDAPLNLLLGNDLYLSCSLYIDEDHWHRDWNDKLRTFRGTKWSKLTVLKHEIARWWPYGIQDDDKASVRSGVPGRPSTMHLVDAEHEARWTRGEALGPVGQEANALRRWFTTTHPTVQAPGATAIANRIRGRHRERKGILLNKNIVGV